jgi:GNAT superfamily N-acetyltransferase
MSLRDWELLPRSWGFKYEYWDGRAHLTPRPFGIPMRRTLEACPLVSEVPATQEHVEGLVRPYRLCFGPAELLWMPRAQLRTHAREALEEHFQGRRGRPLPEASFVVIQRRRPVAALLVVEGPKLDLVFVHPRHQRQGLGSRLLQAACSHLWAAGHRHLGSRVHCHNQGSYAWHASHGFEEVPDAWVARQRLAVAMWECRRAELLGQDVSGWEAERERLDREVNRLEELEWGPRHPSGPPTPEA